MKISSLSLPLLAAIGAVSVQATAPMSKYCSPLKTGPLTISNVNGTELTVTRNIEIDYPGNGFLAQPTNTPYPSGFTFYACNMPSMGWKNGTEVHKDTINSYKVYWGKIMFGSDYAHSDGELDGFCLETVGSHGLSFAECNEKNLSQNLRQWFRLRDGFGFDNVIDYYPKVNTKSYIYKGQSVSYFNVHDISTPTPLTVAGRNSGWTMRMG